MRLTALALMLLLSQLLWAGSEGDRLAKQLALMPRENTARGATATLQMLSQLCQNAKTAKHFADRRQFQMMINDLEDHLSTLVAPEAQKALALALPRATAEVQMSICFGLKKAPANADVDGAALKLLTPQADNKVKVALLELLSRHRVFAAVDKILPLVNSQQFPSVQIAACRALAWLPEKRAIPVLLKYLQLMKTKNSRFVHEAVTALRFTTNQKLPADIPGWVKWWADNEKKFEVEPAGWTEPSYNYELAEAAEMSYYQIPVVETKLVFILDVSGSMAYGGRPNRLEQAKVELQNIVKQLRPEQRFNIISFSKGTNRWNRKEALVSATEQAKAEAVKFVEALKPGGGTDTTDVMEEAIGEVGSVEGCEAVYLVTDGDPNPWAARITTPQQERHITWFNQPFKVRVNTIGIYTTTDQEKRTIAKEEDQEAMKRFLYNLAANNDGVYREIGK